MILHDFPGSGSAISRQTAGCLTIDWHPVFTLPFPRLRHWTHRVRIDQAVSERALDLPLWSDSARSISIYEGKHDIPQGPGPKGGPL